eukprot:TRINITY_DN1481_c0_g2_i1.p1 TRINITY_DN1481_c0_g2~~TRINITY_DN1481_c0_g2_i1.p1  ORF type:complete len:1585 (-),score=444.75 TRINITY_DN1481_c0_g2_i1:293-5047(-)
MEDTHLALLSSSSECSSSMKDFIPSRKYSLGIRIGNSVTECTLCDEKGQPLPIFIPATKNRRFPTLVARDFTGFGHEIARKVVEEPLSVYDEIKSSFFSQRREERIKIFQTYITYLCKLVAESYASERSFISVCLAIPDCMGVELIHTKHSEHLWKMSVDNVVSTPSCMFYGFIRKYWKQVDEYVSSRILALKIDKSIGMSSSLLDGKEKEKDEDTMAGIVGDEKNGVRTLRCVSVHIGYTMLEASYIEFGRSFDKLKDEVRVLKSKYSRTGTIESLVLRIMQLPMEVLEAEASPEEIRDGKVEDIRHRLKQAIQCRLWDETELRFDIAGLSTDSPLRVDVPSVTLSGYVRQIGDEIVGLLNGLVKGVGSKNDVDLIIVGGSGREYVMFTDMIKDSVTNTGLLWVLSDQDNGILVADGAAQLHHSCVNRADKFSFKSPIPLPLALEIVSPFGTAGPFTGARRQSGIASTRRVFWKVIERGTSMPCVSKIDLKPADLRRLGTQRTVHLNFYLGSVLPHPFDSEADVSSSSTIDGTEHTKRIGDDREFLPNFLQPLVVRLVNPRGPFSVTVNLRDFGTWHVRVQDIQAGVDKQFWIHLSRDKVVPLTSGKIDEEDVSSMIMHRYHPEYAVGLYHDGFASKLIQQKTIATLPRRSGLLVRSPSPQVSSPSRPASSASFSTMKSEENGVDNTDDTEKGDTGKRSIEQIVDDEKEQHSVQKERSIATEAGKSIFEHRSPTAMKIGTSRFSSWLETSPSPIRSSSAKQHGPRTTYRQYVQTSSAHRFSHFDHDHQRPQTAPLFRTMKRLGADKDGDDDAEEDALLGERQQSMERDVSRTKADDDEDEDEDEIMSIGRDDHVPVYSYYDTTPSFQELSAEEVRWDAMTERKYAHLSETRKRQMQNDIESSRILREAKRIRRLRDEHFDPDSERIFHLQACGLENCDVSAIAHNVVEDLMIEGLDLRRNFIGQSGIKKLAFLLSPKRNACQNIRVLLLDNNPIGSEGARSVFESNMFLETLSLRNCGIGIGGLVASFPREHVEESRALTSYSSADEKRRHKERLSPRDESDIRIHDERTGILHSLKALDISDNHLEAIGLGVSMPLLLAFTSLKVLILAKNRIGSSGCLVLCRYTSSHDSLEWLDVSSNMIDSASCDALAQNLIASRMNLRVLNISDNPIQRRGVDAIARYIMMKKTLVSLALRKINATTPDVRSLLDAAMATPSLVNIDLENNVFLSRDFKDTLKSELSSHLSDPHRSPSDLWTRIGPEIKALHLDGTIDDNDVDAVDDDDQDSDWDVERVQRPSSSFVSPKIARRPLSAVSHALISSPDFKDVIPMTTHDMLDQSLEQYHIEKKKQFMDDEGRDEEWSGVFLSPRVAKTSRHERPKTASSSVGPSGISRRPPSWLISSTGGKSGPEKHKDMISDFVAHEVVRNVRSHTSYSDRDAFRLGRLGRRVAEMDFDGDVEEAKFDHPLHSRGELVNARASTSLGCYSWKQSTRRMERPKTALSSSKKHRVELPDDQLRLVKAASRHGEVRAFWDRAATALGASILSPSVVKYILLSSQNDDDSKRRLRSTLGDEMMKEHMGAHHI